MNNIDKILKEALNGYEAPFDSTMWDKVSSQLSPMEDAFRNTLENHEVPYNPSAWSAIKNKIGSSWSMIQWLTGAAAAITIVTGVLLLWPVEDDNLIVDTANSDTTPIISTNETLLTDDTPANADDLAMSSNETSDNNNYNGQISPVQQDPTSNELSSVNDPNTSSTSVENTLSDETDNLVSQEEDNNTNTEESIDAESNAIDGESTTLVFNADFNASAYNVCQGSTVLFNPKMTKGGTHHSWDFGDGQVSNDNNAVHNYTTAGTFTITHKLLDKNTLNVLAIETQTITVNPIPAATISWEQNFANVPTIDFSYDSDEVNESLWSVDGVVLSDQTNFEHTFRHEGEHIVELQTSNVYGCKYKAQEKINVEEEYNLLAPNVFSPNGDGNNDNFIPKALTVMNNEFEMLIYDKEGHLVFSTTNANNPWDGRDINTQVTAESEVYVWVVTLKNGNGIQETYKGQVLLMR